MAWTYLVESEESAWPLAIGSDLSPTARSTPIVKQSCSLDSMKENCIKRQFGTMSEQFKQAFFPQLRISYAGGSLVRTSVLQAMEKAWTESAVDFFGKSCAYPKRSSPISYSLKTSQRSLLEEEEPWFRRLPKSGMIVDGILYPLLNVGHCTKEKGGFYWPTPRANNKMDCPSERRRDNPQLETIVNIKQSTFGKKLCPRFVELLMGFHLDWTELDHWATQWFQSRRKRRLNT